MDYGRRFKYYRNKAKLSQKKAAQLMGINNYQLGNYETNRSEPSLAILKKMSKLYKVSIDIMLGNKVDNDIINDNAGNTELDEVLSKIKEYIEEIEEIQDK